MASEKRACVRHIIKLPIRFREVKTSTKTATDFKKSHTKNFSEGGLLFLSSGPYAVGTVLELSFPVKDQIFKMRGKVAHAMRDPESGRFRIGICFSRAHHVFKVKMAEQLHQIDCFRKTLSEEQGREVTEEEAAEHWIHKFSSEFSEFYS
jgi:hypothetical protein